MIRPGRVFLPFTILTIGTLITALIIGNPMIYRAALLWSLLFVLALVWTWFCLHGIRISRYTRESRIEFGQAVYETLIITNESWFPKTHLEIFDLSRNQLVNTSRVVSTISAGASLTYSNYFFASRRGYYKLGPTLLRSGDLFGFFVKEIVIPPENDLLVTPIVLKSHLASKSEGSRSIGNLNTNQKANESNSPVSIRDYVPGDPLKKIHWLSTAKYNHYMVKEFELEKETSTYIVLNGREGCAYKEISQKTATILITERKNKVIEIDSTEYLACMAASIASQFISEKKNIGIYTNNANFDFLPPDNELRQLNKILDILAFFEADSQEPFTSYIHKVLGSIPRGNLIYVLSPYTEDGLVELAQKMRAKAHKLHFLCLFPLGEFELLSADYVARFTRFGVKATAIPMDGSILSLQNHLSLRTGERYK